jgi:putative transposase
MHLILKLETTKPAGSNFLQQQARFDDPAALTLVTN